MLAMLALLTPSGLQPPFRESAKTFHAALLISQNILVLTCAGQIAPNSDIRL
jgi:hypothetical protein